MVFGSLLRVGAATTSKKIYVVDGYLALETRAWLDDTRLNIFLWLVDLSWSVGLKMDGGSPSSTSSLSRTITTRLSRRRRTPHGRSGTPLTQRINVRLLALSLTCGTECEQTNDGHTPCIYLPAEERERRAEHGL